MSVSLTTKVYERNALMDEIVQIILCSGSGRPIVGRVGYTNEDGLQLINNDDLVTWLSWDQISSIGIRVFRFEPILIALKGVVRD